MCEAITQKDLETFAVELKDLDEDTKIEKKKDFYEILLRESRLAIGYIHFSTKINDAWIATSWNRKDNKADKQFKDYLDSEKLDYHKCPTCAEYHPKGTPQGRKQVTRRAKHLKKNSFKQELLYYIKKAKKFYKK